MPHEVEEDANFDANIRHDLGLAYEDIQKDVLDSSMERKTYGEYQDNQIPGKLNIYFVLT